MRYMSGYRKGLEGPFLDYVMKKYKGHRTIPDNIVILEELKVKFKRKEEFKWRKNIEN